MADEVIIRHCSPTIVGIKTGNIFNYRFKDHSDEIKSLKSINRRLRSSGLRVIPIKSGKNGTLIYVYRPGKLRRDLSDRSSQEILSRLGYECENVNMCVSRLMYRLKSSDEFPHEIGLFLSYPPEDVKGFIEHRAKECKLVGCWKVYGDEKKAQRTFKKYDQCTRICEFLAAKGCPIERLAVSC